MADVLNRKALLITLCILGLIAIVAFFARRKITNWLTYAVVANLTSA
jgi:hypothetical protein